MGVASLAEPSYYGVRRIDPAAEAERLGRQRTERTERERPFSQGFDAGVLDEYHLVTVNGTPQFMRITLSAERSFPVRGDLGKRIADLIREDLEGVRREAAHD
jgi:hypothetical protein